MNFELFSSQQQQRQEEQQLRREKQIQKAREAKPNIISETRHTYTQMYSLCEHTIFNTLMI